jgi:DNA-directed RNA polymerase subunit RPC12/RpoP
MRRKMDKPDKDKCEACSFGPPDWQYRCDDCGHEFRLPAPKGPADEKDRTCPKCQGRHITRLDVVKSEACPPGG